MSLSIKLLDSVIKKLIEEEPINDYVDLDKNMEINKDLLKNTDYFTEKELVILLKDVRNPIRVKDSWKAVEAYRKDREFYYNQTEEEADRHYKSNGEGSRTNY